MNATTSLPGAERWAAIPHYELGQIQDALRDEDPALYRRIIAKRALLAAYEESDPPVQGITDLLADLRHLCDGLGFDFAALDRAAYQNYSREKADPTRPN